MIKYIYSPLSTAYRVIDEENKHLCSDASLDVILGNSSSTGMIDNISLWMAYRNKAKRKELRK